MAFRCFGKLASNGLTGKMKEIQESLEIFRSICVQKVDGLDMNSDGTKKEKK